MADLDFILQGLSATEDHFASTHHVFSLPNVTTGIVASAFMNAAGASIIAEMVAPLSDRIKVVCRRPERCHNFTGNPNACQ